MIPLPAIGDRIVTGDVCRVVTRVHSQGAIEYDLLENRFLYFFAGTDHGKREWVKTQERICCYDMWQHYAEKDGRLL